MGRELDLLVPPLGCAEVNGDDPGPMHPPEVAVDEAVTRLGAFVAPSVRPTCHRAYSSHEWLSR